MASELSLELLCTSLEHDDVTGVNPELPTILSRPLNEKRPLVGVVRGIPARVLGAPGSFSRLTMCREVGRADPEVKSKAPHWLCLGSDFTLTGSPVRLIVMPWSTLHSGWCACRMNSSWSFCCCSDWISLSSSDFSASSLSVSCNTRTENTMFNEGIEEGRNCFI